MTRSEIFEKYTITNGIILNSGRFMGEACYIPYYFDLWEQDLFDDINPDNSQVFIFEISPEDELEFPELNPYHEVQLTILEDSVVGYSK